MTTVQLTNSSTGLTPHKNMASLKECITNGSSKLKMVDKCFGSSGPVWLSWFASSVAAVDIAFIQ